MSNPRPVNLVLHKASHVLEVEFDTGETFRHDGWKFEIVDMDGRKIDKLIASRPRRKAPETEAEAVG